jgi:hypothetical protein
MAFPRTAGISSSGDISRIWSRKFPQASFAAPRSGNLFAFPADFFPRHKMETVIRSSTFLLLFQVLAVKNWKSDRGGKIEGKYRENGKETLCLKPRKIL